MNIQCFGPLSEDVICKLESALGVTLPGNYREFLKETGGGIVKQDGKAVLLSRMGIIELWLRPLGRQSLWMYSSGMA